MTLRLLAGAALLAVAAPAAAATDCAGLTGLTLDKAVVTSAAVVPADQGVQPPGAKQPVRLPFPVCQITATASPTADSRILIGMLVPLGERWNGKYLQVGNGGFAGQIRWDLVLLGTSKGYATASTDNGHQSADGTDASWGLGHPEKVRDFGERAVPTTTVVAKAILAAMKQAPAKSYFFGCSDGGREALMTAQRHPEDFDGIVAGAPAWAWTRMMGAGAKAIQTSLEPGHALPPAKLPALQAAARAACAGGETYIMDPRLCRFDPGTIACKGAETDQCLTPAQLATARRIYGGVKDPITGQHFPGLEPGAEAAQGNGWTDWGVASNPGDTSRATSAGFMWNYYAYLAKEDPKTDVRQITDKDIVAAHKKLGPWLNADSADLSAFKARGGKLIQYHGWNDPAIPPRLSLEYHAAVKKKDPSANDYMRLFMVPGMLHCRGGDAPTTVDWIAVLENWVEKGQAPSAIVAHGQGKNQTLVMER
jgi:feruloyl esterase